ncbi:MAG: pitrilysin family protein, partial [Smithellaceae bacterium]|nr:pitrilysin family protein [Smithellaceae bacterium]
MKKILLLISLLILLIGCTGLMQQSRCAPPVLADPGSLVFPKLVFQPPQAERIVLANGLVVYFLENHEVPLVDISVVVRTGSAYDTAGKEGLAEITATLMRTGGTTQTNADKLDEELDYLAALLSVSPGRESCSFSLSVLKKDAPRGIDLLSQILISPAFQEDRFVLAKQLKVEDLKRIADDSERLSFREFNRLFYTGDPRGRTATMASVGGINRDDVAQFHRQYLQPANIMVAISGDLSRQEMIALVNRSFSSWSNSAPAAVVPPPPAPVKDRFYFLSKDVPQAVVITGRLAPAKNAPDSFAFEVLDFITGSGGFRSRIFQEIRNDKGLAYSTGSFYNARRNYGVFGTFAMTKSATAAKALSLLKDITTDIRMHGVKESEITWAKNSITNSFIFSFTSSHQIALQQLLLAYDGIPPDYLTTFRDRIGSVNEDNILGAARKYFAADGTVTFVLGDESV